MHMFEINQQNLKSINFCHSSICPQIAQGFRIIYRRQETLRTYCIIYPNPTPLPPPLQMFFALIISHFNDKSKVNGQCTIFGRHRCNYIYNKVNFNQIQMFRHKGRQSDFTDTSENQPRKAPSKVGQDQIKHTYKGLISIPFVTSPQNIKHLYLSHNKIASLKGIEIYVFLTSFNLSYNALTDITELRLLPHPQNISRVSLRKNYFSYGYEDYVVIKFPDLSQLDDIRLPSAKAKAQIFRMANFIETAIIQFYTRGDNVIDSIAGHLEKENLCPNVSHQIYPNRTNLGSLCNSLKNIYWHPSSALQSPKVHQLLSHTKQIIQTINQAQIFACNIAKAHMNYEQQTKQVFKRLCDDILLQFAKRNDQSLQDYLDKEANQAKTYVEVFAALGAFNEDQCEMGKQVFRGAHFQSCSVRYMDKIENSILKDHQMNKLANWQAPEYKTLIPRTTTKWHSFFQNQKGNEQQLYERLPILIYCRQYLEAIVSLVLGKVSQILSLEHQWSSGCTQDQQPQIELNLSNSGIISFGNKEQIAEQIQAQCILNQLEGDSRVGKTSCKEDSSFNIKKYSIRQICLIFKVFRGIKHIQRSKQKNLSTPN